jgi:hypothetical protein
MPISKINRAKWTGGVVQAVEYLLCKCEGLNLNPSPIKKQTNKKQLERPMTVRVNLLIEEKDLVVLLKGCYYSDVSLIINISYMAVPKNCTQSAVKQCPNGSDGNIYLKNI